jgi:hypothetical protein
MTTFNFNKKTFALVQNTEGGQVNAETLFKYKQKGNLVTADYAGGSVTYGKIIAHLEGETLNMLYQCLTTDNQLKAGKAIAKISKTANGKIKLALNWEWLNDSQTKGQSEYIEL